jgi:hypothetical protein
VRERERDAPSEKREKRKTLKERNRRDQ